MSSQVSIKVDWAGNKTVKGLQDAIKARVKYLQGETTESAVTATTINVLKSLRALTGTVGKNPNVIDGKWDIKIEDTAYVSGWANPPRKHQKGRRVVRLGNSNAIDAGDNGNRVVNLAGPYSKSDEKSIKVYKLTIRNTQTSKPPFYSSLILAKGKEEVKKFADERIKRRIKQYKGISKRLLGILMGKVHSSQNVKDQQPSLPVNSSPLPSAFLSQLGVVNKSGSGFANGQFTIKVHDNLVNAALALKNGISDLQTALQKAANSTIGRINKVLDGRGINEKLPTPFPEISKR